MMASALVVSFSKSALATENFFNASSDSVKTEYKVSPNKVMASIGILSSYSLEYLGLQEKQ